MMTLLPGMENDVYIDDVRVTDPPAQQPDGTGNEFVQRRHRHHRVAQQPSHPRLTRPATPCLSDHAGGDGEGEPLFHGPAQQSPYPTVTTLEGQQGAGVQGQSTW